MKMVPDMIVGGSKDKDIPIFTDVVAMINTHVEDLNKSGKQQNRASSFGYLAAAFTAFVSAYLTMLPQYLN